MTGDARRRSSLEASLIAGGKCFEHLALRSGRVAAMSTTGQSEWLAWMPLIAAGAHIFEEFVFPGGFTPWYRQYRHAGVSSISARFLILMNAALVVACLNVGLTARKGVALPYWIMIAALLCANGLWHIWAAVRSRSYSPGMITGTLLYVPLALYGVWALTRTRQVSPLSATVAMVAGASYPMWSAVYHQRSRAMVGQ